MVRCEIELPETVAKALGLAKGHEARELRKDLAAYFFDRGILSFGQARQLAGLPLWHFIDFLRDRKIALHYDENELEDDLETINDFLS